MKVECHLYTPGFSLCQNPTPYQSQLHSRGINRDSTHTKVSPVLSNFQCVHYGSHLCGICTAWSEHTGGTPASPPHSSAVTFNDCLVLGEFCLTTMRKCCEHPAPTQTPVHSIGVNHSAGPGDCSKQLYRAT